MSSEFARLCVSLVVTCVLLFLFADTVDFAASCQAAEQAGVEEEQTGELALATMPLSLSDCIQLALRNNLNIAIKQLDPSITDAQVTAHKGLFDPAFFAGVTYTDVKQPLPITMPAGIRAVLGNAIEVKVFSLYAGAGGMLTTGATYTLQFTDTRVDSSLTAGFPAFGFPRLGSEYDMNASFTLTQPLLKNFGTDVNTTSILVAQNSKEMSLHEFRRQVIQTVSDVQNAYWDLVFAIANYDVQEESLRLAEDLLAENRARAEVGVMAPLDVLQAEARVAAREEGVIVARSNIERQEDNLKKLVNLPRAPVGWDIKFVPTDKPTAVALRFDEAESAGVALRNRPDLAQQMKLLDNSELNVRYAKNQLLPRLDITASYAFQGVEFSYHEALDTMFSEDFPTWRLALSLEFPLSNRKARGNYTKAKLEKRQLEDAIRKTTHDIVVQVRDSIRRTETDLKRIEVTKVAKELARESLEAEEKKLEVGISTSHDVLRFQEELTRAQSSELRAVIDYNKSLVSLFQTIGTTLEHYEIVVQE